MRSDPVVREHRITPNDLDGVDIRGGNPPVDIEVYRDHEGGEITTVFVEREADDYWCRFHGRDGPIVRKGRHRDLELPPFVDVVLDHLDIDYVEEER